MLFHSLTLALTTLAVLSSAAPLAKRRISSAPVIDKNFPDPSYIEADGKYYAFSTESRGHHVPIAVSDDSLNWKVENYDALPHVGEWSTGQAVWAPHVVRLACGTYVMYYTAQSKKDPAIHCIGAATSNNAAGPYTARDKGLRCHFHDGGVIDPSGFQDQDGRQYIVYKVDGNSIGNGGSCGNTVAPIQPTPIMIQQVAAANGYDLIDGPKQILDRDDHDGPLVEAPSLIRVQNKDADGGFMYVLFFSSHCYSGGQYDTRYATSMHGLFNNGDDYRKADKPLLVTGDHEGKLYSPGGMQVSSDGTSVVFHADKDQSSQVRQMWKGKIQVNGREVTI